MAALVVNASAVSQVLNHLCVVRTHLAAPGGVTRGQWVFTTTAGAGAGRVGAGDSAVAGKAAFKGIALNTAGDGGAVDVLERGFVEGFELGALAYEAAVFPNPTGALGTAADNASTAIGKVVALSDRDPATNLPSKVLQVG